MQSKIGLWLIGAKGSVASTVCLGLCELKNCGTNDQAVPPGLVSELPEFQQANLVSWENIVVGGHEIRDIGLVDAVSQFARSSLALDSRLIDQHGAELERMEQGVCPGILSQCGPSIDSLASPNFAKTSAELTSAELMELVKRDLSDFKVSHDLDQVVVVNLASTEPPGDLGHLADNWNGLQQQIAADEVVLPASSLYATAALQLQMPFVNFTPSTGSNLAALKELAMQSGTCHVGQDGKTGETLVKSALAPMFAHRNLQVMSWVGHNIFGNMDARVLDDPANKKSKVESKDKLLGEILGYQPQTHISIENISSLGDWKTAWDHVHFRGFLGTPMIMQFIWQGCDSILAAPLVLDLFRFTERAQRAGQSGVLEFLACFFKSPMATGETLDAGQELTAQFQALQSWCRAL